MKTDPSIENDKSLYPGQEFTDPDDDGWQISYLDIITILLGFLIILLSVSHFTDYEYFSVSKLFKSSTEEAEYISTPINQIEKGLEISLMEELAKGQIEIERDLNDLLIRFPSDELYYLGSATLQTDALNLLNKVIRAIKGNRYNDFQIDVEGHTDDVPIASGAYPSNWELSTARAANVVKYFAGMGIAAERLKASGYGESRPLIPNRDSGGKPILKNQAKNRRIVLRLFYTAPDEPAEVTHEPINEEISGFADNCRFSVQLGGFESFRNALNKASEAIQATGLNFDITYNNRLFSVRTDPIFQLSESLKNYENIRKNYLELVPGIIHQCYERVNERPKSVQYQIQFGAFNNRDNAERLSKQIAQENQLQTTILTTENEVYKVVTKPFIRLESALNQLSKLKNDGFAGSSFLTYYSIHGTPYKFRYQLQAGLFEAETEAKEISHKLTTLMGLKTDIRQMQNGTFVLITEAIENWEQTLQTFEDLSYTSYNLTPAVYLIEELN